MTKLTLLVCCLVVLGYQKSYSQNFSCTDFVINTIQVDSLDPTAYQINIQFNAASSEFVNYPYVSVLMNCTGDTIGTGNLMYFGQFGQTSQDYPVNLNGPSGCFPYYAVLTYQNSLGADEYCLLPFYIVGLTDTHSIIPPVLLSPNPAETVVRIKVVDEMIGSTYRMYNSLGQQVHAGKFESTESVVDVSKLSSGYYTLEFDNSEKNRVKWIKE